MRKKDRQNLIASIIKENSIHTQEELVEHLLQLDVLVTQATISRDIKEMKLAKVTGEDGKVHYQLLDRRQEKQAGRLEKILETSVRKIKYKGEMILLQTVPGMATSLVRVIEEKFSSHIFTVMTDDDKILIFCQSVKDAEIVKGQLKEIINEVGE